MAGGSTAEVLPNVLTGCGAQLGGLQKVEVIPADLFAAYVSAGYDWSSLEYLEGQYQESESETEHGILVKSKLVVEIIRDAPQVQAFRRRYRGVDCIVKCLDRNGVAKIIGSTEYPLRMLAEQETGKSFNSRNSTTLVFTGQSPEAAVISSATFSDPGSGGGSSAPVVIQDVAGNVLFTATPGQTVVLESDFTSDFYLLT